MFLIMAIMMWRQKKMGELKTYVGIHVGMGLLGILLYPASLWHIFASYRGVGAMAAAEQNLGEKMLAWLDVMQANIYIPIVMVVGVIGFLIYRIRIGKVGDWGILVVPELVYLIIVMFLSPYTDVRYLIPGLLVLAVTSTLIVSEFVKMKGVMVGGAIGLVAVGAVLYRPSFLYTDYRLAIARAEESRDETMIYVTDNNFTFVKNLPEYVRYEKSVVVKDNYGEIEKLDLDKGRYVVRMDAYMDKRAILEKMKQQGLEVVEEWDLGPERVGYVMEKK